MLLLLRKLTIDNAYLLLIFCMLGWAGNTIAGRLSTGEISPMVIVFLRWSVVAIFLILLKPSTIRNSIPRFKGKFLWLFLMGGLGYTGFNSLFYIAAHQTTAINLGIIQGVMPAMILVGSVMFFKENTNLIQVGGLLLTFLGVLILVSKGNLEVLLLLSLNYGDLIMFLSCFLYAGFTLGLKYKPSVDPFALMFFFSITALISSIVLLFLEMQYNLVRWPSGLSDYIIILYIAFIPSLLSQLLFIRGVELIGAGKAGLFINLIPIFSALLGVLILKENIEIFHFVSLVVVFSGIYLFMVVGKTNKHNP